MEWRETIAEGLPPPHEREPFELRQDILDEIGDHLACAMKRELRRTEDESTARRAALDRFGDPLTVARRLWWDAMKEKIMRDRILLMGFMVVLVAVVAAFAVPWAVHQHRANEAIIVRLNELDAALAKAGAGQVWPRVKPRLVYDGPDAVPADGMTVKLIESNHLGQVSQEPLERTTGKDGLADFGAVTPGHYRIQTATELLEFTQKLHVTPGQVYDQTICVPRYDLPRTDIGFRISDTAGVQAALIGCHFEFTPAEPPPPDQAWTVKKGYYVLLRSDGRIANVELVDRSDLGARLMRYEAVPLRAENRRTVRWPAGSYRLTQISTYAPVSNRSRGERGPSLYEWIGMSGEGFGGFSCGDSTAPTRPRYEALPDQEDVWTIQAPAVGLATAPS